MRCTYPKIIPPIHHSHTFTHLTLNELNPLRSSLPSLRSLAFLGSRGARKVAKKAVTCYDPAVASGRGDEGREWGGRQAHAVVESKGCPPRPSFCSSARSAMPWLPCLPLALGRRCETGLLNRAPWSALAWGRVSRGDRAWGWVTGTKWRVGPTRGVPLFP